MARQIAVAASMKVLSNRLMMLFSAATFAASGLADEEPKHGGTLTYVIPADAPPSFDGHRESTYATVHSVAPFYSVAGTNERPIFVA
jgi:hypothetical protein